MRKGLICDAIVVGAGIAGLSAALALETGGRRVLVLERGHPGYGASGSAIGQVLSTNFEPPDSSSDVATVEAALEAARSIGAFAHSIDCGWGSGALIAALDHMQAGRLATTADLLRSQYGVAGMRYLDALEVRKATGSDSYHGALFDPLGGAVDPKRLVRAMLAQFNGILRVADVREIVGGPGAWRVRFGAAAASAPLVFIAAGFDTARLVPALAGRLSCEWTLAARTAPLSPIDRKRVLPAGWATSDLSDNPFTMRLDATGRLTFGFGVFGTLPKDRARQLISRLRRAFPDLDPDLEAVWSGPVITTPNRLPLIEEVRPGLWVATGFNGVGLATGFHLGARLLSEF